MKKFTGHREKWGNFVDVKINIAAVLERQLKKEVYRRSRIFLGTVTDPYQPVEAKYLITRRILEILSRFDNPVSILTKTEMVLRDMAIIKRLKEIEVIFTINTLDEEWKILTEPYSSSIERRLKAAGELTREGVTIKIMMGPFWPFFTDADALFAKFHKLGVKHVFSESLNTTGENWSGVEKILKKYYPDIFPKMKKIMFNRDSFRSFYREVAEKISFLSRKYNIPVTIYFEAGLEKFKTK